MAFEDNKGKKDNKTFLIRCVKLLEYLSENTDKENRISQAELRKDRKIEPFLGTGETFHNMIVDLTEALNADGRSVKPEDEWLLVYKAFSEYYGESENEPEEMSKFVKDIYFNHLFTNEEMTAIINSLRTSKAVNGEQVKSLTKKLGRLMSKHYSEPRYKLELHEFTDSPQLAENIVLIQKAISEGRKISFIFNYINRFGMLVPTRSKRYSVSPHYIVSDKGKLYLYGGFDDNTLCDFRIDLMSDIHIQKRGGKAITSAEKHTIRGLPQIMDGEFKANHLNMSYESAIMVEFQWTKRQSKTKELNCTILYNTFGDNFRINDDGIVKVRCSEFGMLIFAMQYSEYVTVLSPDSLCEKLADRVRELNEKYL